MNSKAVRIMLAAVIAFSMVMINICMVNADAAADWYDQKQVNYTVVVSASDGYVNIRSGPGVNYQILSSADNGVVLNVVAESVAANGKTWGQVNYGGIYGWVALSQVSKTDSSAPSPEKPEKQTQIYELYTGGQSADKDVIVSAPDGGVNLRYGPGTEYAVEISMIPNNSALHVSKEAFSANGKMWGYVKYNGTYGWIFLPQTTEISQDVASLDDQATDSDDAEDSEYVNPKAKDISEQEQNAVDNGSNGGGVPIPVVVLIVLVVILIAILAIILILKKKNDGSYND